MGTDNEQEYEIDLKEIAIVILDRIWIVISVGIACALLAGIITKVFITPMYTSTTKLYVINKQNSENNITYTDLQTGNLLTNDYIIQVKGTKVLSQVISELNLTDTEDELASRITVSNPENSRFIVISVSDKDPVVAQQIASCVAEVSSDVVKEVMDLEKVNVAEEANLPLEKTYLSTNVVKFNFECFKNLMSGLIKVELPPVLPRKSSNILVILFVLSILFISLIFGI